MFEPHVSFRTTCLAAIVVATLGAHTAGAQEAAGQAKSTAEPAKTNLGQGVVTGDFDADGQPDLFVTSGLGRSVLLSDGQDKLSEYWIGVDAVPADEALRAQLQLPDGQGLVINQIVKDSPAESAGVERYDVLLTVDDKPLAELDALKQVVEEKKETQLTLRLVRRGKRIAIELTPQKRPPSQTGETCPSCSKLQDAEFVRRVYLDLLGHLPTAEETQGFIDDKAADKRSQLTNKLLRRSLAASKSCTACHSADAESARLANQLFLDAADVRLVDVSRNLDAGLVGHVRDDLRRWLVVSPARQVELPDDVTVTITRQAKQAGKITVKKAEQTWETTEDKVGELPDEIRGHVERSLGTQPPAAPNPNFWSFDVKAWPSIPTPQPVQPWPALVFEANPPPPTDAKDDQLQPLRAQIADLIQAVKQLEQKLDSIQQKKP